MNAMSLEEQIAVFLVWNLPKGTTITVGQVKEIALVIACFVERLGMKEGEANTYERVKDYIKTQFPKTFAAASKKCHEDNCQSMASVLIETIAKLTNNVDEEREEI